MAFPQDPADVSVDLYYDGAWHDITTDVRTREDIVISRGREDEAEQAAPSSCTLTLSNATMYSPRNPTSSLYGKIGKNSPIRVRVGASQAGLRLPGRTGSYASTPDTAALDITGDLDIRMELTPETWDPDGTRTLIVSKYASTGDQRSWALRLLDSGVLELAWTTDGTSGTRQVRPGDTPVPAGTTAVRATLDVDNGATGNTVVYYTAATVAGPWTQLGAASVSSGVTSVFASTAELAVGSMAGGVNEFIGDEPLGGIVRAVQVRNGIDGTLVADPDFAALPPDAGGTVFTDSTSLVWTVHGDAYIEDLSVRFAGEVANWGPSSDVSGNDDTVRIQANGIRRRLGQGESPLRSALYRASTNPARTDGLVAYWSCEEDGDADRITSGIGGPALQLGLTAGADASDVRFSGYGDFLGSAAITEFEGDGAEGAIPITTATGELQVIKAVHVPEDGVAASGGNVSALQTLLTFRTTGSAARWTVYLNGDGNLTLYAFNTWGDLVLNPLPMVYNVNGRNILLGVRLVQNGSNIDWSLFTRRESDGVISNAGTLNSHTVGSARQLSIGGGELAGTAVGHVAVHNANLDTLRDNLYEALDAYAGEPAGTRMLRLAAEEQVPFRVVGDPAATELLGPQRVSTLLDLLDLAATSDLGSLHESRDALALEYRTRRSLYNQTPVLELDYNQGQLAPPLEPSDDDQFTRNDITVSREGGGRFRVSRETGPMSASSPPEGVGRYESSETLTLRSDGRMVNQGFWRLHLGTVDELRFPQVTIALHGSPALVDATLAMMIGDRTTISNLPSWLPPGSADILAQGYTEIIGEGGYAHIFVLTCTPASPWTVAVGEDPTRGRADTVASELVAAIDSTQTTMDVATLRGPKWTIDPAQFPFDLTMGGEEVTATGASGAVEDTFTRVETDTWGVTDTGDVWERSGGFDTDLSVDGALGAVALTTTGSARWLSAPGSYTDIDVTATVATDKLAVGAPQQMGLLGRYTDAANMYIALFQFLTDNTTLFYLFKYTAGTGAILVNTNPGLTHVAGTRYGIRLAIKGPKLKAKVWLATDPEPQGWTLRATDTDHTTGRTGVYQLLESGATNAPVTATWDDVVLAAPQKFAITRSTNGVVKPHAAGTAVSLAHPAIVAL